MTSRSEILRQDHHGFPVDGAAPPVQKAGTGQQVGAGTDRTDGRTAPFDMAQGIDHLTAVMLLHIDPGTGKDHAAVGQIFKVAIGGNLNAVAGHDRLTVFRQ